MLTDTGVKGGSSRLRQVSVAVMEGDGGDLGLDYVGFWGYHGFRMTIYGITLYWAVCTKTTCPCDAI